MKSPILIVDASTSRRRSLQTALQARFFEVATDSEPFNVDFDAASFDAALLRYLASDRFGTLLLCAPCVDLHSADPFDEAGGLLSSCFAVARAAVSHFLSYHGAGSLVVLMAAETAMGTESSTLDAAVAGALLSLTRTVAIETRGTGVIVNTLFYASDRQGEATPNAASLEGIDRILLTLADSAASSITGQEIFVTGGAQVGRLRP